MDALPKKLADSTIKQYQGRLDRVAKAGIPLDDPDKMFAWFEKEQLGMSAQKLYLSALKWSLEDKAPAVYGNKIKEMMNSIRKVEINQDLTERQQPNSLSYDEIMKVQRELHAKTDKTKRDWLDLVIVSLYSLQPPARADYGEMKVFSKREGKKWEGNQLVWAKGNPRFIYKIYKTASKYGTTIVKVSKDLYKVLEGWFTYLGKVPEFLLDRHLTDNAFTQLVIDTFERLTAKRVGITLLRHAYITKMYPLMKTRKQKEELAAKMMHSVDRQEIYNNPAEKGKKIEVLEKEIASPPHVKKTRKVSIKAGVSFDL